MNAIPITASFLAQSTSVTTEEGSQMSRSGLKRQLTVAKKTDHSLKRQRFGDYQPTVLTDEQKHKRNLRRLERLLKSADANDLDSDRLDEPNEDFMQLHVKRGHAPALTKKDLSPRTDEQEGAGVLSRSIVGTKQQYYDGHKIYYQRMKSQWASKKSPPLKS